MHGDDDMESGEDREDEKTKREINERAAIVSKLKTLKNELKEMSKINVASALNRNSYLYNDIDITLDFLKDKIGAEINAVTGFTSGEFQQYKDSLNYQYNKNIVKVLAALEKLIKRISLSPPNQATIMLLDYLNDKIGLDGVRIDGFLRRWRNEALLSNPSYDSTSAILLATEKTGKAVKRREREPLVKENSRNSLDEEQANSRRQRQETLKERQREEESPKRSAELVSLRDASRARLYKLEQTYETFDQMNAAFTRALDRLRDLEKTLRICAVIFCIPQLPILEQVSKSFNKEL